MSSVAAVIKAEILIPESQEYQERKWRRYFHHIENAVITLALTALVVLPLAESVLRKTLHLGISGSTALVQHFTLILGMIGGVIAAREERLLPLSTLGTLLKGKTKTAASVFSGSCSTTVGALLCWASLQFVLSEREAGKILAYGIPVWFVQLVMPFGFALITAYLVWHAARTWVGRLASAAIAGAMLLVCARFSLSSEHLVIPALIVLLVATLIGVPVFATVGGAALLASGGCTSRSPPFPSTTIRWLPIPPCPPCLFLRSPGTSWRRAEPPSGWCAFSRRFSGRSGAARPSSQPWCALSSPPSPELRE